MLKTLHFFPRQLVHFRSMHGINIKNSEMKLTIERKLRIKGTSLRKWRKLLISLTLFGKVPRHLWVGRVPAFQLNLRLGMSWSLQQRK